MAITYTANVGTPGFETPPVSAYQYSGAVLGVSGFIWQMHQKNQFNFFDANQRGVTSVVPSACKSHNAVVVDYQRKVVPQADRDDIVSVSKLNENYIYNDAVPANTIWRSVSITGGIGAFDDNVGQHITTRVRKKYVKRPDTFATFTVASFPVALTGSSSSYQIEEHKIKAFIPSIYDPVAKKITDADDIPAAMDWIKGKYLVFFNGNISTNYPMLVDNDAFIGDADYVEVDTTMSDETLNRAIMFGGKVGTVAVSGQSVALQTASTGAGGGSGLYKNKLDNYLFPVDPTTWEPTTPAQLQSTDLGYFAPGAEITIAHETSRFPPACNYPTVEFAVAKYKYDPVTRTIVADGLAYPYTALVDTFTADVSSGSCVSYNKLFTKKLTIADIGAKPFDDQIQYRVIVRYDTGDGLGWIRDSNPLVFINQWGGLPYPHKIKPLALTNAIGMTVDSSTTSGFKGYVHKDILSGWTSDYESIITSNNEVIGDLSVTGAISGGNLSLSITDMKRYYTPFHEFITRYPSSGTSIPGWTLESGWVSPERHGLHLINSKGKFWNHTTKKWVTARFAPNQSTTGVIPWDSYATRFTDSQGLTRNLHNLTNCVIADTDKVGPWYLSLYVVLPFVNRRINRTISFAVQNSEVYFVKTLRTWKIDNNIVTQQFSVV